MWASFMELTGRVEISRTVPCRGGEAVSLEYGFSEFLYGRIDPR